MFGSNVLQKEEKIVPVFVFNAKAKKEKKKAFDKEWAKKLAESNKGSFNQ